MLFGKPKVDYEDLILEMALPDAEVRRLNVSMDEPPRVNLFDCIEHLELYASYIKGEKAY